MPASPRLRSSARRSSRPASSELSPSSAAAPSSLPAAALVLAMDVGTSSLRTALFTAAGKRLVPTTSQQAYHLRTADDGTAELAADKIWAAAAAALKETLAQREANPAWRRRPIVGWGSSCFWHSLVGVDADLKPLTPVYTWADSRCALDAARLREQFAEGEVHARTGCMLRASYWPAKLAWLRRTASDQASGRRVAAWLTPADFLYARFCGLRPADGTLVTGLSMASGTGLLNLPTGAWDQPLLDHLQVPADRLPRVAGAHEPPGRLAPAWARRFPALAETPVFPALGDGAASNLGSGATVPGVAALNFGTSAALRTVRTGAYQPPPAGLFCYAVDHTRWLLGGATSNAGNARVWASHLFAGDGGEAALERAFRHRPGPRPHPGRYPLVVLPFLTGERAPTWREDLPGLIFGLHLNHGASDLFQAVVEGTYLRLAQIVDPLERALGGDPLRFVVSGGIVHSVEAVRRLCDVLGRTCTVSPEREASLRGAAVAALERLGVSPEIEATDPAPRVLEPQAHVHRQYLDLRRWQERLEALLAEPALVDLTTREPTHAPQPEPEPGSTPAAPRRRRSAKKEASPRKTGRPTTGRARRA